MKTVNYVCPSCGGNVEFNKKDKKWICPYCNKRYDILHEHDENSNNFMKNQIKVNSYYCSKCNKKYSFFNSDVKKCPKCNEHFLTKEDTFFLRGVVLCDKTKEYASKLFKTFCNKKYGKEFSSKIVDKNIYELKYEQCSIYTGKVIVTLKTKKKEYKEEYFFTNVPYLENDDISYSFKAKVACHGIKMSEIKYLNDDINTKFFSDNIVYKKEVVNLEKEFETICLNHLKKRVKEPIIEEKVDSYFMKDSNVYLPYYYNEFLFRSDLCKCYIPCYFGSHGSLNSSVFLEIPSFVKGNSSDKKDDIYYVRKVVKNVLIILTGFFLFSVYVVSVFGELNFYSFFELFISIIVVYLLYMFFIIPKHLWGVIFNKADKFLEKNYVFTKDDFFDSFVNGDNFNVKKGR